MAWEDEMKGILLAAATATALCDSRQEMTFALVHHHNHSLSHNFNHRCLIMPLDSCHERGRHRHSLLLLCLREEELCLEVVLAAAGEAAESVCSRW